MTRIVITTIAYTAVAMALTWAALTALVVFLQWDLGYWTIAEWGWFGRTVMLVVQAFWVVAGVHYVKQLKRRRSGL